MVQIEVQGRSAIRISVSEAKAQLTELVRRAEAGDEVILTRRHQPAARLVAAETVKATRARKRALLEALRGAAKADFVPDAAHSNDFLYDDHSLPA